MQGVAPLVQREHLAGTLATRAWTQPKWLKRKEAAMTLLKTLQAWCRAAFLLRRHRPDANQRAEEADIAQRVRLSGEW